jgi:hypothetical protein
MGSEIVVVEPRIYEEKASRSIIDKAKKEVEQIIYEFVCSLGEAVTDSERSKNTCTIEKFYRKTKTL